MILGEMWRLSWWIYHFLLLASMIVMLIGLMKQYVVKGSFVGAIRDDYLQTIHLKELQIVLRQVLKL